MRKFDAVLLDMDGTLVDSEKLYDRADEQMFENLGITVTHEERVSLVGINLKMGTSLLLKLHPEINMTFDELFEVYENSLLGALQNAEDLALIPGVEEWLKTLKASGVKMAVASSSTKKMVDHVVERLGLRDYVEYVINGEMIRNSKPDPEIFLLAAKELGIKPENCAVLEDSGAGIEAAKAAGMYCVAYSGTNVHGVDQSRADVVIDEYTNETLKYLLG